MARRASAGRSMNSWSAHDRTSLLRNRARRRRSYSCSAKWSPARWPIDGIRRELGRHERAVQTLAAERIDETGGIANQHEALAGRSAHAVDQRADEWPPRPSRRRRTRPSARGHGLNGIVDNVGRSASRKPGPQIGLAHHQAEIDALARHWRNAHVPAFADDHARRLSGERPMSGQRAALEPDRSAWPHRAARATSDVGPSAPTTTRALQVRHAGLPATRSAWGPTDRLRLREPPRLRIRERRACGSGRARSAPGARGRFRRLWWGDGYSRRQRALPSAVRDFHRRDRSDQSGQVVVRQSKPGQPPSRERRGIDAARPPDWLRQSLEHDDVTSGRCQVRGHGRAGRTAADDRHLRLEFAFHDARTPVRSGTAGVPIDA